MSAINAILFDMDGVLYAYDFENRLKLLEAALDVPGETIRAEIFESGLEDGHDDGATDTAAYIQGISERLGVEVTLRQWVSARKWAMAPEPAMIDLARELKARLPIALLTNNGPMLFENIADLAPELPPLFESNLFVSGVHGFNKERSSGFSGVLAHLNWRAEATLFVDDNPGYIAMADEAGLVTHVFDGIEGLKVRMAELGL